jgi:hypothetical protein
MFFNKETKQAFVFPPKNGTMSTRTFLGSIEWHGKHPIHGTTADLIKKYPALLEYKIYGFYRDPIKRFESSILYLKQVPITHRGELKDLLGCTSVEDAPYEVFASDKFLEAMPEFFNKQVEWFDHPKVTALDFNNLEAELRRITGNTTQPMPHKNKNSDFGRKEITPAVVEFVKKHYAEDYEFARRVLKIEG